MQLIYSIPDKLYYIQNFLDYSTYKGIHNSIFKERKTINLHTSKGIWSEELINYSSSKKSRCTKLPTI